MVWARSQFGPPSSVLRVDSGSLLEAAFSGSKLASAIPALRIVDTAQRSIARKYEVQRLKPTLMALSMKAGLERNSQLISSKCEFRRLQQSHKLHVP
jgi:hypothetical protein